MSTIGFIQTNQSTKHVANPWRTEYSQNSTIFGKHTFVPINMEKALNDNVIVVGTSGTGKTYSFVEPNILQVNTNYVVADAKGDILRDTGASFKKMGYKIQVLNLVDLQHSNTYNPLVYLNDPLDYLQFAYQVITSDVTGFHSAKDSRQDPFWDTAAETLLQHLFISLKNFCLKISKIWAMLIGCSICLTRRPKASVML